MPDDGNSAVSPVRRALRRLKRQLGWIAHMIDKIGYETFLSDFGGHASAPEPERRHGWVCDVPAAGPDVDSAPMGHCEEIPGSYETERNWDEE